MPNSWYLKASLSVGILLMLLLPSAAFVPVAPAYIFVEGAHICSYSAKTPYPSANDTRNCFLTGQRNKHVRLGMLLSRNSILIAHNGRVQQKVLAPNYRKESQIYDKNLIRNSAIIHDIAVDWVSGNIYYIHNDTKESVNVMDLNGNYTITLHQNISGISGLAVTPVQGYLFWTVRYTKSTGVIGRSNLDGTSKQTRFYINVEGPVKICVDQTEQRIYWADKVRGSIESTDFSGNNHRVIVQGGTNTPLSLTVSENYVIWINYNGYKIYWTSKLTGTHDSSTNQERGYPLDIINYSEYSQPKGLKNFCSGENNGQCSQICLPRASNIRICKCSLGYQLHSDGKTCFPAIKKINYSNTLFIGDGGRGQIFVMDPTNNFSVSALPFPKQQDMTTIVIDPIDNSIFWAERSNDKIFKGSIKDGNVEIIATLKDHNIHGLAIDFTEKLIFFSDYTTGWTESMQYDGTILTTLVRGNHTISMAADIINKKLYMAVLEPTKPQIVSMSYTGGNYKVLIKEGLKTPTHITIDAIAGKMYWSDYNSLVIETANLDGTNRKVLYKLESTFQGSIALLGDYLYVAELIYDNQVGRIHLRSNDMKLEKIGTDEFLNIRILATSIPGYGHPFSLDSRSDTDFNGNVVIAIPVAVSALITILIFIFTVIRCNSKKKPQVPEPTVSFSNPGYGNLPAPISTPDENANVTESSLVAYPTSGASGTLPQKQVHFVVEESSNSGGYEKLRF